MVHKNLIILLYSIFCLSSFVDADCKLSNSRGNATELLKRLKPLYGETFTYMFSDEVTADKYNFTMRICEGVQIDTGSQYHSDHFGVVQQFRDKSINVGSINDTVIKGGTDWIMLTYRKGEQYRSHCSNQERKAHIMIVCDPYSLKGDFKVLYEENSIVDNPDCFYLMELSSNVACFTLNSGLSSGSIFLIVVFSIVGAYLIFGSIYKRCVYGSKGVDQIPNIGFWKTCGSLQADGCDYLCRCTGSGYNSNKPFQGVADDQLDEEIDDEHLLPM